MSEIVISVENLSKQYRLGLVGTGTLSHDLKRWWYRVRGKEDPYLKIGETNRLSGNGIPEYIWALKDINFEVKQGEVLGVIGKNGAGKSTLLKILSRVTSPTSGAVKLKGRVNSLLEVGTGFHPELTGRENIYLSGAIQGMTKNDIKRKFDEIVDFSGVGSYIDTPVKRYSSGMYVRLAFAVAAHLEPDILIVDEVLAVGDIEFQKKAVGKMKEVSQGKGRTVLFVSHNMGAVKNICMRGMVMNEGTICLDASADDAIRYYMWDDKDVLQTPVLNSEIIDKKAEGIILKNSPTIKIKKILLENDKGSATNSFFSNEPVNIKIYLQAFELLQDIRIICELVDEFGNPILASQVSDTPIFPELIGENLLTPGIHGFTCIIPKNLLSEKRYYISVHAINIKMEHIMLKKVLYFDVTFTGYNNVQYGSGSNSFLRPLFEWRHEIINSGIC